jgi:catalase
MAHPWNWCAPVRLAIATTLAMSAIASASADKLPPPQPSAAAIVNQFQINGGVFPGFRRNHAKGVCISGYFQSSGNAARYSVAQVFVPDERTPVVGRLSIPGTNPYAWDSSTPIRGMALDFLQANGQQWRTAINGVPAFPVASPEANYQFLKAQQPVRATGDPDPQKLSAFFSTHPTANAFRIWDRTTKPSSSFATVRYNSLDSFELVDANGKRRAVRWSMVPLASATGAHAPPDQPNYLFADLRRRLSRGPLRWHLVIVFAQSGDKVDDAAIAWPASNPHIDAGTLVIRASQPQRVAVCRDISFNPLVLPQGIAPSDDPLLKDRAATYAASHRRRIREQQPPTRAANPVAAATTAPKHPHWRQ